VGLAEVGGQSRLVVGAGDGAVTTWDPHDGTPRGAFSVHWNVSTVTLTEVGGTQLVLGGTNGGIVRVVELATESLVAELRTGVYGPVTAIATAELDDRLTVVSAAEDGAVRVWDASEDSNGDTTSRGHTDWLRAVAVADAGTRAIVVSGGDDRTLRTWDLESGAPLAPPFEGHEDWVKAIAVVRLGGRTVIFSGSDDHSLRRWELDGRPIGEPITGHESWVSALAHVALDARPGIVSAEVGGNLRMWDAEQGALLGEFRSDASVNGLAAAQLAGRPVIAAAGNSLRLLEWRAGFRLLDEHSDAPRMLAVAAGMLAGRPVLALGCGDGTVELRALDDVSRVLETRPLHADAVNAVAFAELRGQALVISGGEDAALCAWSTGTGETARYAIGSPIMALAIHGSDIVVGTKAGLLRLRLGA
jgi:WD40 repeat protein